MESANNNYCLLISARDVITCRLHNNHVKVTGNHVKVTSNHVMYDRSAWFPRVIMPTSRDPCCLPTVKRQKHDFQVFVLVLSLFSLLLLLPMMMRCSSFVFLLVGVVVCLFVCSFLPFAKLVLFRYLAWFNISNIIIHYQKNYTYYMFFSVH